MNDTIRVEVVFALPDRQVLEEVELPAGATVGQAIDAARIARQFPDYEIDALDVGIWGRVASRDTEVRAGDRVELYRPLEIDPKEARRRRAMGQA